MKLNGLEKYFETDENGEIVDFKQMDKYGETPLMVAVNYNKEFNFNLSNEQFDYLIKKSDLKQIDKCGSSKLMYIFIYNQSQNINLNKEQLDYLIKNSDLKQVDKYGSSTLKFALGYNKSQNLNLSHENWKYLIDNSDLSLITEEIHLIELKKIQSELLNAEILNKIDIKEKNRINKI